MITPLWRQRILPFTLLVVVLGGGTLLGDYLLHRHDLVWVGRYLGIPGTLLIFGSLYYSLRKRKLVTRGNPTQLLRIHEFSAWFGSLLILIHAGIHFTAVLPWLATIAMGVNVISGMVGKLLLSGSHRLLAQQRERFQLRGMPRDSVEQALFWDAVAVEAMTQWRKVHIPIFIVFSLLTLAHILSILLLWGWR